MTTTLHVDILGAILPASVEKLDMNALSILSQQDNDPEHTAKSTKAGFENNNINILEKN